MIIAQAGMALTYYFIQFAKILLLCIFVITILVLNVKKIKKKGWGFVNKVFHLYSFEEL
jgi:hypothetical protein